MAEVHKSAATLPDPNAAKPGKADVRINHGALRTSAHAAVIASGDSVASTYEVARIPSHARILKLSKLHTSGVAGVNDADLGVEGAANCLMAGQSLTSAGAKDAAAAIAVADIGKALWELAGLSADPKKEMSVFLTLNAAATGAGTVAADLVYVCE